VNSGQDIPFSIEVASNSKDKINNFLVSVEYPFGFVFKSATPAASFGSNIWQFSGLEPGQKKTIIIRGSIIGQNNEERVFRINAGSASESDERQIGVSFTKLTESLIVKQAFIGLDVLIDNKEGDYAGQGGREVATNLTKEIICLQNFTMFQSKQLSKAELLMRQIFCQTTMAFSNHPMTQSFGIKDQYPSFQKLILVIKKICHFV
jgi:hypothetical protein